MGKEDDLLLYLVQNPANDMPGKYLSAFKQWEAKNGQSSSSSMGLGDKVYDLWREIVYCALRCGELKFAIGLTERLKKSVPGPSNVIRRLEAQILEAALKSDEADSIYSNLIDKNPSDFHSLCRQISLRKSLGHDDEALVLLNSYLRIFQSDYSAWMEAAELYAAKLDFRAAAFCLEEVLLGQPNNPHAHIRFAELQYSIGVADSFSLACDHFAHALTLLSHEDKTNRRALFGLCLCLQRGHGKPALLSLARERVKAIPGSSAGHFAQLLQ